MGKARELLRTPAKWIWKRVFQVEETESRNVQRPECCKVGKASVAYATWTREKQMR